MHQQKHTGGDFRHMKSSLKRHNLASSKSLSYYQNIKIMK